MKKKQVEETPKKREIVTFKDVGAYTLDGLRQDSPSCINYSVNVIKYRVTVEEVEEPIETIQQRLQDLWDICNNYHHWKPLENMAKKYNYELQGSAGNKLTHKD